MKSYLKWSLYIASHIVCLNTFTLHFPNEKILIWNEVFSETRGHLRTLQRHDRLWTVRPAFDFPDRPEFFLSWNSWSFSKSHNMFEYIHSLFREQKRSLEYAIFSEMKSYLKWSLLWNSLSSLNSSKALSSLNLLSSSNSSKVWLSLNSFSNSSKAWSSLNLFSSLNLWSSSNCSTSL